MVCMVPGLELMTSQTCPITTRKWFPQKFILHFKFDFAKNPSPVQCDQFWRNFATMAKLYKSFDSLFLFRQNAEPTLANL